MATPILPDTFKNLIPNPNAPMCDEMSKALLQFPEAFWQWYNYYYNADGTISTAAAQDICAALTLIGCASGGSTTTSHATSFPSSSSTTPHGSTTTTVGPDALVYAVTDKNNFIEINLADGSVSVIKASGTSSFFSLARNPMTGTIYGLIYNTGTSMVQVCVVDPVTGNESAPFDLSPQPGILFMNMAFNSAGACFVEVGAVPNSPTPNSQLFSLNPADGTFTSLGSQSSRAFSSIAVKGLVLYGLGSKDLDPDECLFSISQTTGAVTFINKMSPVEGLSSNPKLVVVSGVMWRMNINQISQLNTASGVVTDIGSGTYDNSGHGNIKGMCYV